MDVREKLVELLNGVQHYGTICTMSQMDDRYARITQVSNTEVAERLIAHSVTVQEWISVKDRLPEDYKERVLVKIKDANNIIGHPDMDTDRYMGDIWVRWGHNVTHWMPLPKPPKGE